MIVPPAVGSRAAISVAAEELLLVIETKFAAMSAATELLNEVVEPLIVVSLRLLAKLAAISAAAELLLLVIETKLAAISAAAEEFINKMPKKC